MTREKMKSIFTVHTNGEDEWIKVPKRTYDKMIDMFCDAHEAKLTKACEILEGANLAEIERHFAECKAKDERIGEMQRIVSRVIETLTGLSSVSIENVLNKETGLIVHYYAFYDDERSGHNTISLHRIIDKISYKDERIAGLTKNVEELTMLEETAKRYSKR